MRNPLFILLMTSAMLMGATYNKIVVTKDSQSSFTQPSTATMTNNDMFLAPGGAYHGDGSQLTGISSGSGGGITFTNVPSRTTNTIDFTKSLGWVISPLTNDVVITTVGSSNGVNGTIWFVGGTSDRSVYLPSQWDGRLFDGGLTNTAYSNKISFVSVIYKGSGETNAAATFR